MNAHKYIRSLFLCFCLLTAPSVHASLAQWLNRPLEKATDQVKMQTNVAKEAVKNESDPRAIRATATAAIESANSSTQEALAQQKALIDAASAKLDTREKIFSASVVGLFVSNGLTIFTLVAGRRRSKIEMRGLELENEKKEIELQELRRKRDDPNPKNA